MQTSSLKHDGSWVGILSGPGASVLVIVIFGVWLHAADALLVTTMLPAIVADLGGTASLHWSLTFYEIGSIIGASASAYLVARYTLSAPLTLSAGLFSIGCLISAVAPNFELLVFGRLVQGLAGGCLVGLSFVAIRRAFPPHQYGRAMACVTTVWAASAFLGPLLGGIAVGFGSWRYGFAAFFLQALLLMMVCVWRRDTLATGASGTTLSPVSPPLARLALLAAGVSALAFAGSEHIHPAAMAGTIGLGLLCLLAFVLRDARTSAARILPSGMVRVTDPMSAGLWMVLCLAASTIAINIYVPFFLVSLLDVSALTAGYVIATEALFWTITAALLSGSPEHRDRLLIGIGIGVITLSALGLLVSVPSGNFWLITVSAILQGIGFGTAWALIMRRIVGLAPEAEKDRAAAAIPTLQRTGFAIGATFLGLIATSSGLRDGASLAELTQAAGWIFSGSLIPLALSIFLCTKFLRRG